MLSIFARPDSRSFARGLVRDQFGAELMYTAVAWYEDSLIGIAMSGLSLDQTDEAQQLYLLYAYARSTVPARVPHSSMQQLTTTRPAALWVADPSPRARAFNRKNVLVTDQSGEN